MTMKALNTYICKNIQEGLLDADLDNLDDLEGALKIQQEINQQSNREIISDVSLDHGTLKLVLRADMLFTLNRYLDPIWQEDPALASQIQRGEVVIKARSMYPSVALYLYDGGEKTIPRDWTCVSQSAFNPRITLRADSTIKQSKGWHLRALGKNSMVTVYAPSSTTGSPNLVDYYIEADKIWLFDYNRISAVRPHKNCSFRAHQELQVLSDHGMKLYIRPEAITYLRLNDTGLISTTFFSSAARLRKMKEQYKITDILADPVWVDVIKDTPKLTFCKRARTRPYALQFVRDPKNFNKLHSPQPIQLSDGWYLATVVD